MTPSVQATGNFDGNLVYASSCLTVEVLVVVRAGVIKLLEYPPDRGVTGYFQNCLQKDEKILSTSTSFRRNFAVNCSCGPC